MNLKYIFFGTLVVLFISCEKSISQENVKDSLIYEIAYSNSYKIYREALVEDLKKESSGAYDREEVMKYLNDNFEAGQDLCEIDFSKSSIRGIEIMIGGMCKVGSALDILFEEYPEFNSFSREERVKVGEIYTSEVRKERINYKN